jgi:hypothetical protein
MWHGAFWCRGVQRVFVTGWLDYSYAIQGLVVVSWSASHVDLLPRRHGSYLVSVRP